MRLIHLTKKMTFILLAALLPSLGFSQDQEIKSPNNKIAVKFSISEGKALYSVYYSDTQILNASKLGLIREDEDFSQQLSLEAASKVEIVKDNYELLIGKKRKCSYLGNKRIFHVKNAAGKKLDIIFQVSNDGVAFRYYFPETSTDIKKIKQEVSTFHFYQETKAFLHPHRNPKEGWEHSQPSYEEHYEQGIMVGKSAPYVAGWVYPALFNYKSYWILLTETALERNYCATHLNQESPDGEYSIGFPQVGETTSKDAALTPESTLPWYSPWRVICIGESLATPIESTLGTDLSTPAKYKTSFVKAGQASWSWIILKDESMKYDIQKKYIDFAAKQKWAYCLLDADWDTGVGYEKVKELADYGKTKNVGLLLWYNSAGDWNTVKYHPKDILLNPETRKKEFKRIHEMGIKGVKIDFFGGDGQSMIAYYQDILEDAAKYEIMVNFHGCTIPRGWHRTYPNLVSMESVFGYENITFTQPNADAEPNHACMLNFTRNAFDPMDFTPMNLTEIPNIKRKTSSTFELALSVLFLSGIQHYAETPEGMSKVPTYVSKFVTDLPKAWDEVRFIEGYPGKLVVIARKSGKNWYIAGINGENIEKTLSIQLPDLKSDTEGDLIIDGKDNRSFETKKVTISPTKSLTLKINGNGGFVIKL